MLRLVISMRQIRHPMRCIGFLQMLAGPSSWGCIYLAQGQVILCSGEGNLGRLPRVEPTCGSGLQAPGISSSLGDWDME